MKPSHKSSRKNEDDADVIMLVIFAFIGLILSSMITYGVMFNKNANYVPDKVVFSPEHTQAIVTFDLTNTKQLLIFNELAQACEIYNVSNCIVKDERRTP